MLTGTPSHLQWIFGEFIENGIPWPTFRSAATGQYFATSEDTKFFLTNEPFGWHLIEFGDNYRFVRIS